jgi:hypothetical protein
MTTLSRGWRTLSEVRIGMGRVTDIPLQSNVFFQNSVLQNLWVPLIGAKGSGEGR